jgi:beta-glucanase (GH16 family)
MRRDTPRSPPVSLAVAGLLVALLAAGCSNQPAQWTLAWSDDFDGPAGTPPDATYWSHDVGGSGWGNAELQYYTSRPENAALDGDGHLAITARQESYQGRAYTSARIQTGGKFEQGPGRWEARIKLPVGQGIWPAFWLLGANYPTVGWPACGEIDVMEERGQAPSTVNGTLHGPGFSGGSAITAQYTCQAIPGGTPVCPFDADFHVYAVEIEPDRIRFEVDGAIYQEVKQLDQPLGSAWPFGGPFFAILNVAVGGNYVGAPNGDTVFPQTMLVDYVRYYRLDQ